MPTRNVVLTDHQEALIEALVESGRYQNASEVLREGLRLVEQRHAEDAAKIAALRDAIRVADESIAREGVREFDNVEDLVAHLNAVADAALNPGRQR